ncbi:chitinase CLP-like [Oryza brachyantha]|uniref:chitinase CLP-like n=1 Tax=Oryza brachyantha TaxID=4533 RepID=UPI001ADC55C1|nr:chitinase CLP-like [Oryza brachyantha]
MAVLLLVQCTAQAASDQKPLVSRITQDFNTSLYTVSIKNGAPLVVDLAGSLVWSTCPSTHSTVPCQSGTCGAASQQGPPRCRYVDGGWFWSGREPGSRCVCTAHPFNPVTGKCSTGDLTGFAMSANTTNGTDLLYPEALTAVGACAPERLLASLPQAAAGVAGFSATPLSLPSQLAAQRGFGNRFALCLPVFAAFGDTPVYLPNYNPSGPFDYTKRIQQTPFLTNPRTPGYYLPVKGISVSWRGPSVPVSLPAGALDLDVRTGRGGVVLSTVTPNAVMRPDVFRAFAKAFDTVVVRDSGGRMAREAPGHRRFELCYGGAGGTSFTFPMMKWTGIDAPAITLQLGAGATGNWTILNSNYLREWSCVGVVEMGPEGMPVDGEPAVVLGGVQLENVLLVFDLDKRTLGFSRLLEWDLTSCYSATMFRYKLPTTQP